MSIIGNTLLEIDYFYIPVAEIEIILSTESGNNDANFKTCIPPRLALLKASVLCYCINHDIIAITRQVRATL